MDFDEYDYLEKAVESSEAGRKASEKKKDAGDKPERSYRNRHEGEDDTRSSKRSRLLEGQNGHRKERDDRERASRSERRDRDRERSGRDAEKEHDSKDKERGRERDRPREKEREREREKEREPDKEREREREREKEREKERERPRRPRNDHLRDGRREIERGRSRDKDGRERELENDVRERDGRKFREKKEMVEPEADPERDQRTVFAYQMPLKANEKDIYEFFSKAGKVRDVRLIMDRNSRRSKGVGYVEFYDAMSVPMAIALSGQQLLGQPVMVKPSEAEKNLVQSNASVGAVGGLTGPGVARKLYVGNLHFNMTEDQLRQVFESFGPVELVQLPLDMETGQCKGFGFVQFAQLEHAKAALSLNGKLEIAGRFIKVSAVTDHVGVQDIGANAADFDDDDGGGLSLNARSRAMLMQKLDRTGIATSIAGSLGVPAMNGMPPNQQAAGLSVIGQAPLTASAPALVVTSPATESVGDPSECLLLKNMFDPSTETEPDFDLDIKEEVQEECSNFGQVKHIYVDRNSSGHVYLRFDTVAASVSAQRAMHMRWYARRLISATFMRPHDYEAKFRSTE